MPYKKEIRTDLADERLELSRAETGELSGVRSAEEERDGFRIVTVDVLDGEGSQALCKPTGRYVTVFIDALLRRQEDSFGNAATLLAELLRPLLRSDLGGGTLVAGLGNRAVTPDAVGPLAADNVMVTRHLKERLPEQFAAFSEVSALRPGVLASTGVESAELVRSVCERVSPARVVAVDALASASLDRLCRTVQLSDAGIVPGSGVGNDRAELSRETLGVPVVSIGTPTVVDASAFTDDSSAEGMFVTPRDIDSSVRDVGKLIGYALNLALHDGLTLADIDLFLS